MTIFWEVHGIWYLLFMCCFPRLTLLFTAVWAGPLWWIGLIIAPRLLVAILATTVYWQTNPVLCIIAWFWALGGESGEKAVAGRRRKR